MSSIVWKLTWLCLTSMTARGRRDTGKQQEDASHQAASKLNRGSATAWQRSRQANFKGGLRMRTAVVGYVLALAAALCGPRADASDHRLRAHFLDVGQGSAAILETECAAILIDTGGEANNEFDSTQALLDQIEQFFFGRPHLAKTFQLLVLTHPHIDHTRGVDAVLQRYRVLNALTNGQEASSGRAGQRALHRAVAASEQNGGDVIGFEPIRVAELPPMGLSNDVVNPVACSSTNPKITALWGTAETAGWSKSDASNQNNHSVVLRVDFGSASMLLTGDLENRGIAGLLERYKNTGLLDTDVYLVGHHGAANATTEAFLNQVTPKIAVISMGVPERTTMWTAWAYGHPRKPIVQQLLKHVSTPRPARQVEVATGVKSFEKLWVKKAVYATGWDGTVVIEATETGDWSLVSDQPDMPPMSTPRHPVAQPSAPPKVNVNTASADELDTLPMIGLKRAKSIVKYREETGAFTSIDDLANVPGMGKGTLKTIRPLVTVSSR